MNYSSEEKACIWLDLFDFLSLAKKNAIINKYKNFDNLLENFKNDINEFLFLLKREEIDNMIAFLDEFFLENRLKIYEKKEIICITRFSEKFPEKLQTLDEPLVIYAKGNLDLLESRYSIAIVGSRSPTMYGKKITEKFSRSLTQNGFTIVSGLAYGVDAIAHSVCLKEKGKTIAVLGSGFDNVYPAANYGLYLSILENDGLVLSEYRPEVKPLGYHFPNRNRLIVGAAKGVLITEATEKSGTTYTKDYAIDSGTPLMVIPGNIDSPSSAGCNRILKNYTCSLITSVDDVLAEYNFKEEQRIANEKSYQFNFEEQSIINFLGNEQKHYDEILMATQLPSKILNVSLTTLQLKGIIKKYVGNFYQVII